MDCQGESVRQAAVREAKEEIGVEIDESDIKVLSFLHRFSGKREYLDIFCQAAKWKGTISNMEKEKCRYTYKENAQSSFFSLLSLYDFICEKRSQFF
jgi:8-oxo-dGTP pyrophosphatase MutT (NUDIX family)